MIDNPEWGRQSDLIRVGVTMEIGFRNRVCPVLTAARELTVRPRSEGRVQRRQPLNVASC